MATTILSRHTKYRHFFSWFNKKQPQSKQPQPQKITSSPPSPPPQPQSPPPPQQQINRDMGGAAAHAMKRVPLIKFPQRHLKPTSSGSTTQTQATPAASDVPSSFFSRPAPSDKSLGGKASLQPKRTPMSQEEIDAIMLGGCF